MKNGFNIRSAKPTDANFAASMFYLSMDELANHLFGMKADVIENTIAKLYQRNAARFGYRSAFVAEFDERSVGLLVAFRGDKLIRLNYETIPHLISVLGFAKAAGFVWRAFALPGGREAEKDEFHIANIGIIPSMQGRSFGSQLLAYAEQLALERDLLKCSLIVGWDNTSARRLYERTGYRIVETVKDEINHHGYYRMVKVL